MSLLVFLSTGCKKFLDVNTDPNNPLKVQESLILSPVEVTISTNVAGGCFSLSNYNGVAEITSYWTQQIALNQLQPQVDNYKLPSSLTDQPWITQYTSVLMNLKLINDEAEEKGHHSYGVISKILTAYTLGITTDMWGDVPYSKAFQGAANLKPTYDKQEDIYKTIQSLLDQAISENENQPVGGVVPGTDDFIYGGDMSLWEKFAYTLKARYYMHLTKAPGYSATTQAGLALAALQKGFSSVADEANFSAYTSTAGSESPWYENVDPSQGGVVLASTLINTLVNRNDPRLPIIAKKGSGGSYLGRVIGSDPDPNYKVYSGINSFYAAINAPVSIVSYSEALFLKAEATFITSGAAAANSIYVSAINSNMSKLGLDTTSTSVTSYITSRGTLTSGNAIQQIIEDKFIANFLSIENFNDWRRTGFPTLSIVQNPYTATIPRRFSYPLGEITSNPQPQQSALVTDRVWWDAQ